MPREKGAGRKTGRKDTLGREIYEFGGTAERATEESSVSGDYKSATSDFSNMSVDDAYEQEMKHYDELNDAINDNFDFTDDSYVSFTDGKKRYSDMEEFLNDYAYRETYGGDTSTMRMNLNFCDVSEDQLINHVNAVTVGIIAEDGGNGDEIFRVEGSEADPYGSISIRPSELIEYDSQEDHYFADLNDQYQAVSQYLCLNDDLYSKMEYDALHRAVSDTDIRTNIIDRVDSDRQNYEYENGEFSSEDEADKWESERFKHYEGIINKETIASTMSDMLNNGELERGSDLEFNRDSQEYDITDWETTTRVLDAVYERG